MAKNSKQILVVEDEKPLANALQLKLKNKGHSVVIAKDGQEGIDLIKQNSFDVVLLDLMMPVLNGFQVLEQMAPLETKPTVYVLSNLAQTEDEERALKLGAKKFMIKSDTQLTEIIEEIDSI